jgi:hypothetical protein
VCALSGLAANSWCPNRRREWAAVEAPVVPCNWHHLGDDGLLTILPAEYQAWQGDGGFAVRRADARGAGRRPDVRSASARPVVQAAALQITSPADGSTYLIDPTLRREFQALALKAASTAAGPISWMVNGRPVGSSSRGGGLDWPLVPGTHRIEARDTAGRSARAEITVR